jgi:hypothetical protein
VWRDGEDIARGLAARLSRRGLLGRLSSVTFGIVVGPLAGDVVRRPIEPAYYGFCGHTYTTHHCPGPYFPPRIDRYGYPLRPADGHPVDNLGRPVDADGYALDGSGSLLRGPTGQPVDRAPRTRLCQDWVPEQYGFPTQFDGAWYRCCGNQIRKLVDCCAHHDRRINGDAALVGYCFAGRKVFCVLYYDTGVPC